MIAFATAAVTGAVAPPARGAPATPAADGVHREESAAFEASRRTVAPGGLRLVQSPLGEAPPGKPAEIAVNVEGDSETLVATLELGHRRGDAFNTTRAPCAPIGAPTLVSNGAGAASQPIVGGVTDPRAAIAAPAIAGGGTSAGAPAHTPWFKRWWVWTIIGAVALGGGVAAYAGTRGGGDGLTTYMAQTRQ